jgi:hypothetical protein
MVSYYQVIAGFKFSGSKPLLISLSLHTTHTYCSSLFRLPRPPLSISRIFHTLPQANSYIGYLYSRYPREHSSHSTAQRPVLDPLQLLLF